MDVDAPDVVAAGEDLMARHHITWLDLFDGYWWTRWERLVRLRRAWWWARSPQGTGRQ